LGKFTLNHKVGFAMAKGLTKEGIGMAEGAAEVETPILTDYVNMLFVSDKRWSI
jgi:hypothetical protein